MSEDDRGEQCQRCKEWGEDRRTLWMACFYEMSELRLPFERIAFHGHICEQTGENPSSVFPNRPLPVWAEPSGEARHYPFYTLRVCKGCRADWMESIRQWFHTVEPKEESCGSGIFVRENGAIREITMEEWHRRNGDGTTPVRFVGE